MPLSPWNFIVKKMAKMKADQGRVILHEGKEFVAGPNPYETFDYGADAKGYWGVSHVKQINNFYDALDKTDELHLSGEEALKTQKMMGAIYESGKKQERIYL